MYIKVMLDIFCVKADHGPSLIPLWPSSRWELFIQNIENNIKKDIIN